MKKTEVDKRRYFDEIRKLIQVECAECGKPFKVFRCIMLEPENDESYCSKCKKNENAIYLVEEGFEALTSKEVIETKFFLSISDKVLEELDVERRKIIREELEDMAKKGELNQWIRNQLIDLIKQKKVKIEARRK